MNPTDIIANAIRTADGGHTMGAGGLAEVAAEALTDPAIIATAVQAMVDRGYHEHVDEAALAAIAVTVLRSVAGGA